MPKTVDEQIDEAVKDLGVLFDGVDEGTLVFVPADDGEIADPEAVVEQIVKLLENERFADVAGYAVRLVA